MSRSMIVTALVSAAGVAVIVVACGILWLNPASDTPTPISDPATLTLIALPADLPAWPTRIDAAVDPWPHYERAMRLYRDHQATPSESIQQDVVAALAAASRGGGGGAGLFDTLIDLEPGADVRYGDALAGAASVAVTWADARLADGDLDGATQAALAVLALGRRLIDDHVRLDNRALGVALIHQAGGVLYPIAETASDDPTQRAAGPTIDDLTALAAAIDAAAEQLDRRARVVRAPDPNVGDLVRLAASDPDRTGRVEATLWLGVARYTSTDRGNRLAIDAALAAARASDDPMIAEAAVAADSLTREQVRRLR